VQETFVRAWQRLGELRDPGAALGWLVRIAQNAAKDRVRGRKRSDVEPPERESGDRPDVALATAQQDIFVRRAVGALSEKHRVVLLLHEVDGMTAAEIARLLDVPVGTVESRLSRARAGLMKRLLKEEGRR
jgi:RNA polymerase sigma-70 factor (ECF subfamily)